MSSCDFEFEMELEGLDDTFELACIFEGGFGIDAGI